MFCSNCGREVSSDAKFCDGCGSPILLSSVPLSSTDSVEQIQQGPVPPTGWNNYSSYAQPSVSVQPTQQKGSSLFDQLWFKILIGVLAAAIVFGGGWFIATNLNKKSDSSDAQKSEQVVDNRGSKLNSDTSDKSGDNLSIVSDDTVDDSAGSTDDKEGTSDLISDTSDILSDIGNMITGASGILDSKENPTLGAFINNDTKSVISALESAGWEYDDIFAGWVTDDYNNLYCVYGEDYEELSESEYKDLGKNGGGKSVIASIMLDADNYKSLDDFLDDALNVNVVERYDDGEGGSLLVVKTDSGEFDLCLIGYDDDIELYRMEIATAASIESGFAQDYFWVEGDTIEEMWEYFTGESISL